MKYALSTTIFALSATALMAGGHSMAPSVEAMDQDVSGGTVTATKVVAPANGWMVVHRTDAEMKPGPVVGYAALKEGENMDVAAILQGRRRIGRDADADGAWRRWGHVDRRVRIYAGRQGRRPDPGGRQVGDDGRDSQLKNEKGPPKWRAFWLEQRLIYFSRRFRAASSFSRSALSWMKPCASF